MRCGRIGLLLILIVAMLACGPVHGEWTWHQTAGRWTGYGFGDGYHNCPCPPAATHGHGCLCQRLGLMTPCSSCGCGSNGEQAGACDAGLSCANARPATPTSPFSASLIPARAWAPPPVAARDASPAIGPRQARYPQLDSPVRWAEHPSTSPLPHRSR